MESLLGIAASVIVVGIFIIEIEVMRMDRRRRPLASKRRHFGNGLEGSLGWRFPAFAWPCGRRL